MQQKKPEQTINTIENLNLDGIVFKLLPFPGLHSNSDLLIFLPDQGGLFTGDLFSPGFYPYIEDPSHLDLWINACKELLKDSSRLKWVIPGHGRLMTPDEMILQLQYLVNLNDYINNCFLEGKDKESAREGFDFSPYQKENKHTFLHENNFSVIWKHLADMHTR